MNFHSKQLIYEILSRELDEANAKWKANCHLMGAPLLQKRLEDIRLAIQELKKLPTNGDFVCDECRKPFWVHELNDVID